MYAMLNQPERTKLTILKEKKILKLRNEEKSDRPINSSTTRRPATKQNQKEETKATTKAYKFGGLAWQNNLLYRVVPKWKTLGDCY